MSSNTIYNPRSLGAIQPFVTNNPLNIISLRSPTTSDKALVGQVWINTLTNSVFQLTSIVSGSFTWTDLTGGSGSFTTLTLAGTGSGTTLAVQTGNVVVSSGTLTVTGAGADSITSSQASATAISLTASNAAGGMSLTTGTGGTLITSTGAISLSAAGNVSVIPGTATAASPTAQVTINERVGVGTFTGFTTANGGATQDLSILSNKITTTSAVMVTVTNLNVSGNGAFMTIEGITQSTGDLFIILANNGAGALGAGDNILVSFWILS